MASGRRMIEEDRFLVSQRPADGDVGEVSGVQVGLYSVEGGLGSVTLVGP